MFTFPPEACFQSPWRPYQARILNEFEKHGQDRHFHVIAAPGSGKTVLGLELARRLDRPTLILAPTLAIRDQWITRYMECFLHQRERPDWISVDLLALGTLTVTTYQGLHAATRKAGTAALLGQIRTAGVQTLVLDEAHHLRSAWWKCLSALKTGLEEPWIIALTATPPYDVSQLEWNRYAHLCGPVDAEVPVPELVRAGNLCPHQDYLYFNSPGQEEQEKLHRFHLHMRRLVNDLALNQDFSQRLAGHPVVQNPDSHLDFLLERHEYCLSIAVFLAETAPHEVAPLRAALGFGAVALPLFDAGWAEILFNGLLFGRDPHWPADPLLKKTERELRQHGAVDHRRVYLELPPRLRRLVESSPGKCQSIASILELEARNDPHNLRAVVLCDFIREQDFPQPGDRERTFSRLGVVPVFETIRRLRLPGVRPAILTGSLVVLPEPAANRLRQGWQPAAHAAGQDLAFEPLWHAPEWVRVSARHRSLLALVTALFELGEINVVVGTASLLGEGWDAPALNTLILASFVGSYMLSNQMRGRAIRVDPKRPYKVSNIWHLATLLVDPAEPAETSPDWQLLARRFETFAGVAAEQPTIENGIERLGIQMEESPDQVHLWNSIMCRRAENRAEVAREWQAALTIQSDSSTRMATETLVPARRLATHPVVAHGLQSQNRWLRWLLIWWVRRRFRQIGLAVLDAACELELFRTDRRDLSLVVTLGVRQLRCRLDGSTTHEETLFSQLLGEVLNPAFSPRYLLLWRGSVFCCPASLSSNRRKRAVLLKAWRKRLGRAKFSHTRTEQGMRQLIKAKERWLSERFTIGTGRRWLS